MPPTKTDAVLAAAEEEFADDPERVELLRRARRFKSSWVELAEALTEVRTSGGFRRWGYESLEAYATSELHLRRETVEKLTGSFAFLKRRAPEVLRAGLAAKVPSYQAIDFLRRAEEAAAPKEVVREIQKRVLEDAAPLASLSKQYRDTVFPMNDDDRRRRDAAALKNVATRLRELLDETSLLPAKVSKETAHALDRLLEALPSSDERAA